MFTVTPLLGGGTLVEGSDVTGKTGRTILISDAYDRLVSYRNHTVANEEFAKVVDEFFAPLTDAAAQAQAIAHPPVAEWSKVVVSEATEFEPEVSFNLDMDGVLLRLLNETDGSTLRWVGEDTLVAIQP